MHARTTLVALALMSAAIGCGPSKAHVNHGLEGGTYFLCCTLHFNPDRQASDAGYAYDPGSILPAGTPVQVVREDERLVALQPLGGTERFNLIFRYGRNVITAGQYFQEVLLREDPRPEIARLRPEIADAIARSELRIGMTKTEALRARGYPPRHRTSGIEADEWLFYQTRDTVWRVRFEAGFLTEVTTDRAPGS